MLVIERFFQKLFPVSLFLCGMAACHPHKDNVELEALNYKLVERMTEFPDSSFFSIITHAEYHDGRIYLMDKNRGDLIALTEDFKQMECIAPHSETDLVMPNSFTIYQDTAYICDEGSVNTLKVYTKGSKIGSFQTMRLREKRMAADETSLYVSFPTESSCFLKIDKYNPAKYVQAGNVVEEESAKRTKLTNHKHLFLNDGILYAVSECYPYIDSYRAETGEWLKRIDLSDIPVMQSNLSFIESQPVEQNSYYALIGEGYMHNDALYLLCPTLGDNETFRDNTLLKIDISGGDMKPVGICELPGRCYSSICVSDKYLYAVYRYQDCAIEKYELKE